MYVGMYVRMYVCTYLCMYVYTYVHTYIHTYTQHDASTLFGCLQTASVPCQRINKLGTHGHHRDRSAAAAIFAN